MLFKLLVISVIWVEINFVVGENKDIYELEFWSRAPNVGGKRRSYRRNNDMGRRIRRPLRDTDKQKSTRIEPGAAQSTSHPKTSHEFRQENKNTDKKLIGDDSSELLSAYSVKKSMEKLSQDLGKDANITVEVIGRTFEYNDIVILKMAEKASVIGKYFRANDDKYMDETPVKKIIFIVHGLSTKGLRNLNCLSRFKNFLQLLNYYMDHLDQFDIYLIPLANPDGYIKMFNEMYWNKNVSPQSTCNGVALDRNFDVAWGGSIAAGSCSQNYPGTTPFSEPETKAIRDVFHRYGHKIIAFIHVHAGSYISSSFKGEAVLYPKGYTEAQTDDDKYLDMKGEIDEALRNASFQRMTVTTDSLYRWYGKVSGTSVDYAATVFGIPYALEFVMETYNHDSLEKAALTAVWKRVIDAVFNFIHKRGDPSDAQRR